MVSHIRRSDNGVKIIDNHDFAVYVDQLSDLKRKKREKKNIWRKKKPIGLFSFNKKRAQVTNFPSISPYVRIPLNDKYFHGSAPGEHCIRMIRRMKNKRAHFSTWSIIEPKDKGYSQRMKDEARKLPNFSSRSQRERPPRQILYTKETNQWQIPTRKN